jgi:tetratricopeptide (TPR) repeat protein
MFTIVWILASTALVQPAPQAAPTALGQAYFLFVEGLVLEDKGDVDGAVRLYREALELVPDAAEIYAELAALYARQGLATESVGEARKAIAIEPANREANRILGFVLGTIADQRRDASMREEAIGHFETALSGGVRDPGAQLMVSRLAMESRRYKLAITWLTRFLLDQTGYREAMELLAEAYEADGQPARAAELVAELVDGADDPLRVRTWLAELHEDAGAWRQAAAVWQILEASVPDSVLYSMRRAMALANAGEPEAAGRVLEELTARAPDNVRAWYLRSQVERRAGNVNGALAAAERVRALDGDSAMGFVALAEAQLAALDPAGAASTLEARVKSARADDIEGGMFARMAGLLAVALQEAGHTDRAITALEEAATQAPGDQDVLFALGAAYDRGGRFEDAERAFRRVISRDSAHADALNYLGYMLADRGERLDEAVRLIGRALAVEADNPSYLDSLGWAHFKQGDFARAREPLERAAAAMPRTSVVQDHLGDLYLQIKRYKDAAEAFGRALTGDRIGIDPVNVEEKRTRARELAGGR